MIRERLVIAQYCDDIRQELGNKFTLAGCYSDALIVERFPLVLPKLCIFARALTPIDRPFERVIFRAFQDEVQLAEIEMPLEALQKVQSASVEAGGTIEAFGFNALMTFVPLVAPERCHLRVEVETESGILRSNGLVVRTTDPSEVIAKKENLPVGSTMRARAHKSTATTQ